MNNQVDLKRFKKIINKVRELGFDTFYQAGTISKYNELNLIIEDKEKDVQYWITKISGNFRIIYRKSVNNSKLPQHRIECQTTQKKVCEELEKLVLSFN